MTALATEVPVKTSTNVYEEATTIPLKQVQTESQEIKAPNDGVKKKLADNERKQIAKERAYKNLRYEVK